MSAPAAYDVIIIGTGAGGGTLARRLAPSGKRILLLERGDWLPREPKNWSVGDVFIDNLYISKDTWTDGEGRPFQPQIHYFVGGATKLYGAALYRLRAEDFGELRLIFRRPPKLGVQRLGHRDPEPDQLVIRLDPSAGLRIQLDARAAEDDEPQMVPLDRGLGQEGTTAATPYEVLLHAALSGDSTRFARQDGVEKRWRIVQPLLDRPPAVEHYSPGSWGPIGAERLLGGYGRWHAPWTTETA
jgi:choline dehydrogenase-like flavoprotein